MAEIGSAPTATRDGFVSATPPPRTKGGSRGTSSSTTERDNGPDMQEERRRREREKDAVLKGYLRQAIDAEKQEKVEAAQWNYQKVLEMEPENRIALQRLGIIAANLTARGRHQREVVYSGAQKDLGERKGCS